jgi:hypothetical protein
MKRKNEAFIKNKRCNEALKCDNEAIFRPKRPHSLLKSFSMLLKFR